MTLQQGWDNTATANVITSIFGYNENSSESGGDERRSAIPVLLDEWFHGDIRREPWPSDRSNALGTKSLEEYTDTFPDFRIKTAVEIGIDTDGQTISDYEVQMRDEDLKDPTTLSPVTLEGGPDEGYNPFRSTFDHYDGDKQQLPANAKGPLTKQKGPSEITVDEIEGVRGSIIFGGNDPYLVKLRADAIPFDEITSEDVPRDVNRYYAKVPAFYAFLDFVFMADGTKLARVWDVSRYPAHALYVDGQYRAKRDFRDGHEWTPTGNFQQAFGAFAIESLVPGLTPFGDPGYFGYDDTFQIGIGNHPEMTYRKGGASLSAQTVENELSDPLPPSPT
jgi:hypothetical protein